MVLLWWSQREQAASVVVKRAAPETRETPTLAQFDLSEDVHVARGARVSVVVVEEEPRQKRARAASKSKDEEEEKEDDDGGCNLLDGAYDSD